MATVTRYPSSNSAGSGTWSNPTNAYSGTDTDAVASITRGTTKNSQDDRYYGTFGFDGVIPVGATITSVQIEVRHRVATTSNICYLECAPRLGSTDGTFNSDSAEPTTLTARTYSSQTRPGGGSWTRNDLLDGTFQVTLRARNGNNATENTWSWDYVRVTVAYTETHSASGAATLASPTVAGTATQVPKPVWTVSGAVTLPAVQVAQPTPAEELLRLPRLRWVPAKGGVYRHKWTVETVWDVIEGWRPGTTVIEAVGTTKTVTGAVTLSSLTVAGAAKVTRAASGAITLDSPTVAGTATHVPLIVHSASGAITLTSPTVAGTAERVVTASGAVTLGPMTVAGTAERIVTASGTVLLPGITIAGTAERVVTASGAALISDPTVAGAASVIRHASGAITLSLTVDGSATHVGEVTHTVTGAALLPTLTAAGAAAVARTASGTIVLTSPTVAGTALHVPEVVHDASGTVILPDPTVVGSAAVTRHASGAITLALTVDGDASISGQVVASGAVTLEDPTVAGAAVVGRYVTGAITLDDLAVAGSALLAGKTFASGTVTLDDPVAAGAAIVGRHASGAVTLAPFTVSGTATAISKTGYAETPAGRGGARRRRRYVLEIDGREFMVEGLAEAQSLLAQAQELARVAAERQAVAAEQRALPRARRSGKVPAIRLTPPLVRGPEELRAEVEQAQAAIAAAFDQAALEAELRALMAWAQERDDEEALLLSL